MNSLIYKKIIDLTFTVIFVLSKIKQNITYIPKTSTIKTYNSREKKIISNWVNSIQTRLSLLTLLKFFYDSITLTTCKFEPRRRRYLYMGRWPIEIAKPLSVIYGPLTHRDCLPSILYFWASPQIYSHKILYFLSYLNFVIHFIHKTYINYVNYEIKIRYGLKNSDYYLSILWARAKKRGATANQRVVVLFQRRSLFIYWFS